MRVLLLGKDGQLGRALAASPPPNTMLTAGGRDDADICDVASLAAVINAANPEVIINAAAYTQVEQAESNRADAFAVNSDGAFNIACCARDIGARVVQVSTNYVFAGESSTPYRINSATGPINIYGESKLAGERRVLDVLADDAAIIRTAWLYSTCAGNFLTTVLTLMMKRPNLRIVADQIGTPTSTKSLAQAIWRAIDRGLSGIHHWTDAGVGSWFDFAVAIHDEALKLGVLTRPVSIEAIRSEDYPTLARRPAYGVLDMSVTQAKLDISRPHWRAELKDTLRLYADA